jgi:nitrite reductase/ring-hydroxylating ferredoxin subunit
MKKYLSFILLFLVLSCDKNNPVNNNANLPDYSFAFNINTSLPSYNKLLFISSPVLIDSEGVGINGVIVMKTGDNSYIAFEASCPNQALTACSKLSINGINAKCSCDSKEYNLYTGVLTGDSSNQYPLKQYRTELNGDIIKVYN